MRPVLEPTIEQAAKLNIDDAHNLSDWTDKQSESDNEKNKNFNFQQNA